MQETQRKIRFLIAPLDWGLGHATRCIPIIRELLLQHCEVIIAAEGAQEILLRQEFPQLHFVSLPGYRIKYSRSGSLLAFKILLQLPKLKKAIWKEHEWLKQAVADIRPDCIISDNRYGFYHPEIPSIFITHQLRIQSPGGEWTKDILQQFNYKHINRFTTCWIPDNLDTVNNLAGELSHPKKVTDIPVHYIGPLSRFSPKNETERKGHLLVLLSGPEPQRTLLEEKMIDEISHYNGTADIVRGLPDHPSQVPSTGMIQFYNHLGADELNKKMQEAEYIIGRSGYSTIMDIAALNKKSILIPTPGQTEQEYLAVYLEKRGLAISLGQKEFSINKALTRAKVFNWNSFSKDNSESLKAAVTNLIQSLPALG